MRCVTRRRGVRIRGGSGRADEAARCRGRPASHARRRAVDGIPFRVRTGIPWRDLPRTPPRARLPARTGSRA
ncbi:transposase, partial [Streptomyces sp. NPDC056387]|uniref:transposase n=1 Tax=Streptomyces sp. NPDC056387 TaxID=3345803 RepID=UPI0035E1FA12